MVIVFIDLLVLLSFTGVIIIINIIPILDLRCNCKLDCVCDVNEDFGDGRWMGERSSATASPLSFSSNARPDRSAAHARSYIGCKPSHALSF